jgi:hypothetical protein
MPVLIAAVIVVGTLCLVDLLLTFGVIRRLREQTALLAAPDSRERAVIGVPEGELPGGFSATTTTGEVVSGTAGVRVVAFFASGCSACPERVPPLMRYLSRNGIGQDGVLAVVQGGDSVPPPSYLADLTGVARVCAGPDNDGIVQAFQTAAFPSFCLLDARGAVAASTHDPAALPSVGDDLLEPGLNISSAGHSHG